MTYMYFSIKQRHSKLSIEQVQDSIASRWIIQNQVIHSLNKYLNDKDEFKQHHHQMNFSFFQSLLSPWREILSETLKLLTIVSGTNISKAKWDFLMRYLSCLNPGEIHDETRSQCYTTHWWSRIPAEVRHSIAHSKRRHQSQARVEEFKITYPTVRVLRLSRSGG